MWDSLHVPNVTETIIHVLEPHMDGVGNGLVVCVVAKKANLVLTNLLVDRGITYNVNI